MSELDELMDNFGEIPEGIELEFVKSNIVGPYKTHGRYISKTGKRTLNAGWTVEIEDDLKNMHGIDIDAEVTKAMDYEIQAEITRKTKYQEVQDELKNAETESDIDAIRKKLTEMEEEGMVQC